MANRKGKTPTKVPLATPALPASPETAGFLGLSEPDAIHLGERLRKAALVLTVALLTARFLFPGEDSEAGSGLVWVLVLLLTLVLGAVSTWAGGALRLRRSPADLALLALIVIVVLSGFGADDRRVAITLSWEWVGLGGIYLLLRNLPQSSKETGVVAGVLVAVAVAASAVGLYQVLVEDPLTRLQYLQDPERVMRLAGVDPGNPVSRAMFEDRLLGSREPRAPYALANSLAGVLVGPLALGIALWLDQALRRSPRRLGKLMPLLMAAPPLGLILVVLLLTKSRSAYVGLMLALLVIAWKLREAVGTRRLIVAAIALSLVLAGLIGVGIATKQLDRQVVTEASKSLGYRAEYWIGTWGLIAESPRTILMGVGPGNFPGPYLRHKLPTSSEEIVDPHNLFLETWASSGLFALLALLATLGLALRELLRKPHSTEDQRLKSVTHPHDNATSEARTGWIWLSGAGGWLLVLVLGVVNPFEPDTQARWLILGSVGAWSAAMLGPLWARNTLPPWMLGTAALAVLVNLLAAGSLTIPPVALALWVPIALGLSLDETRSAGRYHHVGGRRTGLFLTVAAVGLLGLFVNAVARHDWPARAALAAGQAALNRPRPDFERARESFLRAAEADPLSPDPWLALADLEFRAWSAQGMPAMPEIRDTLAEAFREAVAPPRPRDSLAVERYRMTMLKQLLERRGQVFDPVTQQVIQADLVDAAGKAVRLYPTNAPLRAELVLAAEAVANETLARDQAREALRLDALTPHTDKKLTTAMRRHLRQLLDL